jgi:GDPmannose 4,6-dehydratase
MSNQLTNNQQSIIITGANGQLGQYLIKYLQEKEPNLLIIGTQRHKSYATQPIIYDKTKIVTELLDLTDVHSIESIIAKYKPTYFVNTAANAFVGDSWKVPVQHFECNAVAVLHILEAIRKLSPSTRTFTMGTSEEFGVAHATGPQNEDTPLDPKSPYGASKVASRYIVNVWRNSYNLFAIQGWTFNFESPLRGELYVTRKITKGVVRVTNELEAWDSCTPISLGNIHSYRSWQHAHDVADGIWRMLNQDTPKPYVLSSNETHSIKEFVELAFSEVGIKGRWEGEGLNEKYIKEDTNTILVQVDPQFYRPSDVTFLYGDSSRIRKDLGWEPKYTFKQLVKEMVKSDMDEYQRI